MKPRQQTIDEFRHAVQGVWLDLVIQERKGAELSMALRVAQTKTDQLAGAMYDELTKPAPVNGTTTPARK